MKITLDQATLANAVISHLRGVGVQSDILGVEFRYTRVPYTVFAEVELAEARAAPRPTKATPAPKSDESVMPDEAPSVPVKPLVDPDNLPPVDDTPEVDTPPPSLPTAPLFGGG